jgi:hypothetical protein
LFGKQSTIYIYKPPHRNSLTCQKLTPTPPHQDTAASARLQRHNLYYGAVVLLLQGRVRPAASPRRAALTAPHRPGAPWRAAARRAAARRPGVRCGTVPRRRQLRLGVRGGTELCGSCAAHGGAWHGARSRCLVRPWHGRGAARKRRPHRAEGVELAVDGHEAALEIARGRGDRAHRGLTRHAAITVRRAGDVA